MQARILNIVAGLFALVVICAIGLSAYNGFLGDDSGTATSSGKIETGTIAVAIKGLAFPDGNRIVAVGTTVVWTNDDGATHTVTAADKSFDSGNLTKGHTFSKKFMSIGKYDYYCKIHSFMKGTITVVQPYGAG